MPLSHKNRPLFRPLLERGFTLIEVLVVMGIIAVLAAMLFPALSSARLRSYETDCSNNLRQIGTALYGYATELGNGFFPKPDTSQGTNSYAGPHTNLVRTLHDYIPENSPSWHCKRHLRANNLTLDNVTNTTYFYWAWNLYGQTLVPMNTLSTTSQWFGVGLTKNVPGAVLMSDRFDPIVGLTPTTTTTQYHVGTKLSVPAKSPGTHVLVTGGAVVKISPALGTI